MTINIKNRLAAYAQDIEFFLGSCLKGQGIPCSLVKAMEYSLLAGGKRIRPVLCLAWAEMLGAGRKQVLSFASAIECIHTYSLIHDDLPAMDDDDLRRGRPSNHKKFDEATAVLAGDGLLTEAFSLMLKTELAPDLTCLATRELSLAAGPRGMVGGQLLDMEATGSSDIELRQLQKIHAGKTGALLQASCVSGAILAGNSQQNVQQAKKFGAAVGLAFQVVDDILDVVGNEQELGKPVGSDQEQGKATYPALIGIEKSRELAREQANLAQAALDPYQGEHKQFLSDLAAYIVDRVY